jgi:cell division protein FtsQ
VQSYSENFGYVIKDIEIHNENSSDYCIQLNPEDLLSKYKGSSIILFSAHDLKSDIEKIDCIDKINVRKTISSKAILEVSHKVPIAIWQYEKIFYFVTKSGDVMEIRNDKNLSKFILITGNKELDKTNSLIKFLSTDEELFSKISTASWIGDRRWNISFDNETNLMLPEEFPEVAWNKFIKLQKTNKAFENWEYKTIDLRIPNKIYAR